MFEFLSKKKYNEQLRIIKHLQYDNNINLKNIKIRDEKINKLNRVIEKLNKTNSKYEDIIYQYDQSNNELQEKNKKLENKLIEKEQSRRKSAGKNGYFQKQLNKVNAEKQEMMELINNLIDERQRVMKLKKKPSMTELRKYFKKQ